MANYSELTTLINAYIKENGVQAITGEILNGVLLQMVSQLGEGYSLIGMATPSTDPGTPDAPCAYIASEVGTYTNFGDGFTVDAGEIALFTFDTAWSKEILAQGIGSVGATVDSNVGTPAVSVSFVDGVLSFSFNNLRGIGVASVEQTTTSTESGGTNVITVTLDDGTSSSFQVVNGVGISSVEQTTASSEPSGVNVVTVTLTNGQTETFQVANGVGIVSIEQTTTSTESGGTNIFTVSMSDGQTYDFQVANGAQGVSVSSVEQTTTSTESGGTNVVTVTLSDGTTSTFQVMNGAKGDQGNSGYTGAADELEVVNNLTDGGATAALSAEMGVQLESEISQLSLEVDDYHPETNEAGEFHASEELGVFMKYTSDGFDVAKVSSHLVSLLETAGLLATNTALTGFAEMNEDGLAIVGENLNIAVLVDTSGIHAKNIIEYVTV